MRIIIDPDYSVRKIPLSSRSITGDMSTSKHEAAQEFESTLERDLMDLLEFDITVDKYVSQPVVIEYRDKEEKIRTYTPDIIIYHRRDFAEARKKKTILAEIKYKEDLCQNFREYHPKFRAAMIYARKKGWLFRVYTEEHIRNDYLKNAKFLLGYMQREHDPGIVKAVLDRLYELRESDPQALLASFFSDKWNQANLLPVIWTLIATKSIGTNLHYPLTMSSRIWCINYE